MFITILCLIADALALFMFIFISPLIVLKYIATEKIVADQLPHNLRSGQIVVFRILHQSFFVFSRKANGECCNFIHVFHSFHNFMKKSVRQVNTVVQENKSACSTWLRAANSALILVYSDIRTQNRYD